MNIIHPTLGKARVAESSYYKVYRERGYVLEADYKPAKKTTRRATQVGGNEPETPEPDITSDTVPDET